MGEFVFEGKFVDPGLDPEETDDYPQDREKNEYRYLSPTWINELAKGLTAGAVKHPGETWRTIPPHEHVWRAVRHCMMWLMGDRSEPHLVNAGMRIMMAWETSREDG